MHKYTKLFTLGNPSTQGEKTQQSLTMTLGSIQDIDIFSQEIKGRKLTSCRINKKKILQLYATKDIKRPTVGD